MEQRSFLCKKLRYEETHFADFPCLAHRVIPLRQRGLSARKAREIVPKVSFLFPKFRPERTFDIANIVFNAALVLRRVRLAGTDREPILLREISVRAVDQGIVPGSLHDGCFQVVRHHGGGNASEPFEGFDVAFKKD